jgi:hypothetical protein
MTEPTLSEPADLVDVFYARFVRPLGNLTILFAQAEATWLVLVAALTEGVVNACCAMQRLMSASSDQD